MTNTSIAHVTFFVLITTARVCIANEVEAFLEPYRSASVSAPETGVVQKILVREGDRVEKGQRCAQLNAEVLLASLQVAEAAKNATGALKSAEADAEMRNKQLASYRDLHSRGNATQRELERAQSEAERADARLQNVFEELEIRRLEFARVEAQINQRTIAAPFDGVVVSIEKEEGEYVSPNDPVVLQIVHLDKLAAQFSVPIQSAGSLRAGQLLRLGVGRKRKQCVGVIEYVSPVADAKSSTISVKVRIDNANGELRSGDTCLWDLTFEEPARRSSQSPTRRPIR